MNARHENFQNEEMANKRRVRDPTNDSPARIVEDIWNEPSVFVNYSQNTNSHNNTPGMFQNNRHYCNPNSWFGKIIFVEDIC